MTYNKIIPRILHGFQYGKPIIIIINTKNMINIFTTKTKRGDQIITLKANFIFKLNLKGPNHNILKLID